MATTNTVVGITTRKGPHVQGGELHAFEVAVKVVGTYLTASKPTFDFLAALEASHRQGISALKLKLGVLFQDYNDGTNRYTAPNANIVLSSTGNKVVTFRVDTTDATHSNGDQNAEIADATALSGIFSFMLFASVTGTGL